MPTLASPRRRSSPAGRARARRPRRHLLAVVVAGLVCALLGGAAAAEEEVPRWELGIGIGGVSFPDYVGSDNQNYWPIPIPYFVYRGDRLKVSREAVQGKLFATDRLKLEISMSGSLPVRNDGGVRSKKLDANGDGDTNDPGEGDVRKMPDLDLIGEIGPRLVYIAHGGEWTRHRVSLELPVRAAFATDFTSLEHVGWRGGIGGRYRLRSGPWVHEALVTARIDDGTYNNYFYGVPQRFAIAGERDRYLADGGYSGTSLSLGTSRRIGSFWLGVFFRYITLHGATFDDSPLVTSRSSFIGGLGVAWIFKRSETMIPVE